jgi:hypothetical protein
MAAEERLDVSFVGHERTSFGLDYLAVWDRGVLNLQSANSHTRLGGTTWLVA